MSIGEVLGRLNTAAGKFDEDAALACRSVFDKLGDLVAELAAVQPTIEEGCAEINALNDESRSQTLSDATGEAAAIGARVAEDIISTLNEARAHLYEAGEQLGSVATTVRDWQFGA